VNLIGTTLKIRQYRTHIDIFRGMRYFGDSDSADRGWREAAEGLKLSIC